jgi:hypothetical protein
MGNENEMIARRDLPGKAHFLPEEIAEEAEGHPPVYLLEEEYKKSKRNRNLRPYLIIGAFLAVLWFLMYLASVYFWFSERRVDVNITEFQDVSLRDILDKAKSEELALNEARRSLSDLRTEMEMKIAEAREMGKKERAKINASGATSVEKKTLIRNQKNREEKEIAAIESSYLDKVSQKEEIIKGIESRVEAANRQVKEGMERSARAINNADRLSQIKIENLKIQYDDLLRDLTATYNPTLSGRDAKILSRRVESGNGEMQGGYTVELSRDGRLSEREFTEMRELSAQTDRLLTILQKIPYRNSMPSIIDRIGDFHNRIVSLYDRTLNAMADSARERRETIDAYHYAFEHLTKTQPETGYVVDPRNRQGIRVYLNPVIRIRPGDRARVFRKDDELIGEIEFIVARPEPIAKLIGVEPEKSIRPFDRILIHYGKEQP